MALDEKTLERMLKAQKDALDKARAASKPPAAPAAPAAGERRDLYEEFVRQAQPGEPAKPKGLNAAGYRFPPDPPGGQPLTKANIAKGAGLPPATPAPAPAPSELVAKDTLFEEYQRPDLREHPRTGKGIRTAEAPRTAKEILQDYEPPVPQVHTPRRTPAEAARTPAPAPRATPAEPAAPHTHGGTPAHPAAPAPPAAATPASPSPADRAPRGSDVESDAAHLDAEADLASAREATMSNPRDHGPRRTVTVEDPFREMPPLPGERAVAGSVLSAAQAANPPRTPPAAPSHGDGPSSPHVSDAPALRPGSGPRIAIVQADFNHDLTTRMAEEATQYARQLGATVVHHLHVAGAFDIPLTAKALAARDDVDAVVAIGCVIQGETGHDQVVAGECARKLADLACDSGKPVGLAVTGPRITRAQAEARIHAGRHAVAAVTQQWRGLQALGAARQLAH